MQPKQSSPEHVQAEYEYKTVPLNRILEEHPATHGLGREFSFPVPDALPSGMFSIAGLQWLAVRFPLDVVPIQRDAGYLCVGPLGLYRTFRRDASPDCEISVRVLLDCAEENIRERVLLHGLIAPVLFQISHPHWRAFAGAWSLSRDCGPLHAVVDDPDMRILARRLGVDPRSLRPKKAPHAPRS